MKEITQTKVKTRLEELQEETKQIKKEKDKKYFEEQKSIEEKTKENEILRKKLKDEDEKIQSSFSDKVGEDIAHSKKLIGFIKRYVLIGIITGVPGIALSYLWDKWQENKMVKDLYSKNLSLVTNPSNRELAKEYEILRRKFYKAYDIDKIEKLLMTSDEIEKLKNDNKQIQKLTEEIKNARETYTKNLGNYIENQIIAEQKQKAENEEVVEEESEEELELKEKKFSMK